MPGLTLIERFGISTSVAENPSASVPYLVTGHEDEGTVRQFCQSSIPSRYYDLWLEDYSLSHIGGGTWEIETRYALRRPKGNSSSQSPESAEQSGAAESPPRFRFAVGGETLKVTQSRETRGKYGPGGEPPPDFKGAIGVTADGVEGVDIFVPKYSFEETYTLGSAVVTPQWKAKLYKLCGRTNASQFRGFERGEVLLLSADGGNDGSDTWEVTCRYAASANETDIKIGDITVAEKGGWDYLWVRYKIDEDVNSKMIVTTPIGAYVERVYPEGDFSFLPGGGQ